MNAAVSKTTADADRLAQEVAELKHQAVVKEQEVGDMSSQLAQATQEANHFKMEVRVIAFIPMRNV